MVVSHIPHYNFIPHYSVVDKLTNLRCIGVKFDPNFGADLTLKADSLHLRRARFDVE